MDTIRTLKNSNWVRNVLKVVYSHVKSLNIKVTFYHIVYKCAHHLHNRTWTSKSEGYILPSVVRLCQNFAQLCHYFINEFILLHNCARGLHGRANLTKFYKDSNLWSVFISNFKNDKLPLYKGSLGHKIDLLIIIHYFKAFKNTKD